MSNQENVCAKFSNPYGIPYLKLPHTHPRMLTLQKRLPSNGFQVPEAHPESGPHSVPAMGGLYSYSAEEKTDTEMGNSHTALPDGS